MREAQRFVGAAMLERAREALRAHERALREQTERERQALRRRDRRGAVEADLLEAISGGLPSSEQQVRNVM